MPRTKVTYSETRQKIFIVDVKCSRLPNEEEDFYNEVTKIHKRLKGIEVPNFLALIDLFFNPGYIEDNHPVFLNPRYRIYQYSTYHNGKTNLELKSICQGVLAIFGICNKPEIFSTVTMFARANVTEPYSASLQRPTE